MNISHKLLQKPSSVTTPGRLELNQTRSKNNPPETQSREISAKKLEKGREGNPKVQTHGFELTWLFTTIPTAGRSPPSQSTTGQTGALLIKIQQSITYEQAQTEPLDSNGCEVPIWWQADEALSIISSQLLKSLRIVHMGLIKHESSWFPFIRCNSQNQNLTQNWPTDHGSRIRPHLGKAEARHHHSTVNKKKNSPTVERNPTPKGLTTRNHHTRPLLKLPCSTETPSTRISDRSEKKMRKIGSSTF